MFKCGDGRCVGQKKICDGTFDCIDAADERDCGKCIDENLNLVLFGKKLGYIKAIIISSHRAPIIFSSQLKNHFLDFLYLHCDYNTAKVS